MNFPRLRRAALEAVHSMRSAAKSDAHISLFDSFVGLLADQEMRSFLLPDNGAIIDSKTRSKLTLDVCRMPFTRCALEYSISDDIYTDRTPDNWFPSATVLLVEQGEDGGPIRAHCLWLERKDGIDKWIPSPRAFVLTEESTIEVLQSGIVQLEKLAVTWVHEAFRPSQEAVDQAVKDFTHEAQVLAHFALLCSCDNVSPKKIYEPNAKLIKRSAERGNPPPNDYYVLDCFLGENTERAPRGDGTHASPRFHVRRGHIRRLATGALTWIKQATVGDISNGQVTKDYRAHLPRNTKGQST